MLYKFFWGLRALLYMPFLGKIGLPSYMGKPVLLVGLRKIFIGRYVRIYPNVRIEVHGAAACVKIQDDVAIAQNVHITSGAELVIGKATTILANVFITNIDHDYREIGKHILKQSYLINETTIGENCYIGIGACIQAGTILGKQCIVGANAVVKGHFPNYSVIVGIPAKVIKRYNSVTGNWEKTNPDGSFKSE
jgi:acetyltransferase-like isoleucine patch superfamily enzyme